MNTDKHRKKHVFIGQAFLPAIFFASASVILTSALFGREVRISARKTQTLRAGFHLCPLGQSHHPLTPTQECVGYTRKNDTRE